MTFVMSLAALLAALGFNAEAEPNRGARDASLDRAPSEAATAANMGGVASLPPTPTGSGTLTVNTTSDADDGTCDASHCSLREAIVAANASAGPNTIAFNIPSSDPDCDASGVCTIQPTELLPFLTESGTTIDGFTQPGASASSGVLKIVLDGHDNGGFSGLALRGANNVVRGLVIQRFTPFTGIDIRGTGATGNHIEGNFIGTDATGTQPRGNCTPPVSCGGIWINDGAHDNTVGPDNLIAFNGVGVWITDAGSRGNTISRNRIHSSTTKGIWLAAGGNDELSPPSISAANPTQVSGSACSACVIEVFSDAAAEGAIYEGSTAADAAGAWTLTKAAGFSGPHVTATAADAQGNTSEFSVPVSLIPLATATPTSTATYAPIGSPTPTATPTVPCFGDCGRDGAVTVQELLTMVNIALGNSLVSDCSTGDGNTDGEITIDEILRAVRNALNGCE